MLTITEWAAILSATATGLAAIFVLLEIRHMNKHKDLEVTIKLFEWADDRLKKAFKWVEDEFQFETLEKYNQVAKENRETGEYPYQVEAYFEEIGFLVNKKFVDIDVIVDRLGSHITSNWKKLEPWIIAMRKYRSDDTFGEHFEMLNKKTIAYMAKKVKN
jgi:hypothetical protein